MVFKIVGKVSLKDIFLRFPAKLYLMAKQLVISLDSIVLTMEVKSVPPRAFNVIICIQILTNSQCIYNN